MRFAVMGLIVGLLSGCSLSLPSVTLPSVGGLWSSHAAPVDLPQTRVDAFSQANMPHRLLIVADTGQCDESRHPTQGVMAVGAALHDRPGLILIPGDLAYPDGKASDFAECFDPALGALKPRILPAAGNHEYRSPDARPYFEYFGVMAGTPKEGWYSVNFAHWHIIALNSNLPMDPSSPQYQWLKKDLTSAPQSCRLVFFHHPRFTSGHHGNNALIDPIWRLFNEQKVDLVMTGHDHLYERFTPMNAAGMQDPEGVVQFIVGTGGTVFDDSKRIEPGSEIRQTGLVGLLELDLEDAGYRWRFLTLNDMDFEDRGEGHCHRPYP